MGRVGLNEREGEWYEAHDDFVQVLNQSKTHKERRDEGIKRCFALWKVTLIGLSWHVHMGKKLCCIL